MFTNYLKIAWRNILKNKGYTAINILGLAIGLAACLLISLYVYDELSFDRFNVKADRIYRINDEIKFGGNHLELAVVGTIMGETAKQELPAIENFTRLRWYGGLLIKKGNEIIREGDVAWAESSLFDLFSFPVISGDPKTALSSPNSIVINETIARKYFNSTDVVGKALTIQDDQKGVVNRIITAVIKDLPSNCHFQFRMFVPLLESEDAKNKSWAGSQNWTTYLLLKPGTNIIALNASLNKMQDEHLGPELKSVINKSLEEFNAGGDYFKTNLIRLTDIHLHSDRIGELYGSGNIQYVYIFSAIAFFILIIACINFMNLATARSAKRAREVGVRKVMGSLKFNLIYQFLMEALVTTAIAMFIAYAITKLFLPAFNELAGKHIDSNILFSPKVVCSMLVLIFVVGILSGLYPAFYLSAFQPVAVLKGTMGTGFKKSLFRNALVIFQFTASVVLMTGTLIVYKQLDYLRKKDIGYSRDQMLIINNTGSLGQKIESFKNELLQISGVINGTISGFLPVNFARSNDSFFPSADLDPKAAISMQNWVIDENYIPTMDMKIISGRNFDKSMKTDSTAIIINKAAADFLGIKNIQSANKPLYRFTDPEAKKVVEYHIIGIVKDFNYSSFRDVVKPLAFMYNQDAGNITLKIRGTDAQNILPQINAKWRALSPGLPFEYSFMDDEFNKLFVSEQKVGKLFAVFASLAIFIACLGLFGLATFIAEQRTREIGVRKVLGASVAGVTTLLSKDFIKLVCIAILIATPVAYYIMHKWLQGFVYRIDMQWWVFILAGLMSVFIALLTVSYQAIKAAIANPIRSLRSE